MVGQTGSLPRQLQHIVGSGDVVVLRCTSVAFQVFFMVQTVRYAAGSTAMLVPGGGVGAQNNTAPAQSCGVPGRPSGV